MFAKHLFRGVFLTRNLYRQSSDVQKARTNQQKAFMWELIENKIQSTSDWKKVREDILEKSGPRGAVTPLNIDSMTISACTANKQFDLAFNYLDFLKSEGIELNLGTIGKYFKLLAMKCEEGSGADRQEDEERILQQYEKLRKDYPVLNCSTLEQVIQALCFTKEWRLCLGLLDEMKVSTTPLPSVKCLVISAAFRNRDNDLAWKLLDEMLEINQIPYTSVYLAYLKQVIDDSDPGANKIFTLFNFLQRNHLKLDWEVAKFISEHDDKLNLRSAKLTTVLQRGLCNSCNKRLQKLDLSPEEFSTLKDEVFKKVIIGKDVFNKSTPEELARFKNFVATMGKFDAVVDGLNVAYSAGTRHSPQVLSAFIAAVVTYFVERGKKVLVLGRSHMNRFPQKNWGFVKSNAAVFLTQDLSHDDPYLLYCALNCGQDTVIVSKDLMRSHRFLLGNLHLRMLFQKWLSLRQYQLVRVKETGQALFKYPPLFSTIAQESGGYWHIPYTSDNDPNQIEWLCIKPNKIKN